MKQWIAVVLALLAVGTLTAQISIPNTFTPNTRIVSADVNENFTELGSKALNREGGAMSGDLAVENITFGAHNTYDIGTTGTRARDGWFGRNVAITGTLDVTGVTTVGTLNATTLTGAGSGITGLAEANITDGAVFPRLAGTESITGIYTFERTTPVISLNETDGAVDNRLWRIVVDTESLNLQATNDAVSLGSNFLSVNRTGTTVDSIALAATAVTVTGRINSASAQPGFLAYNSASDSSITSATPIDFDTEVYDLTNSFAADTFTAPVTGVYHFCTGVELTGDVTDVIQPTEMYVSLVASNRTLDLPGGLDGAATPETTVIRVGGCVYVDMDAADTAFIRGNWASGGGEASISGGASPHPTWFSGRLVP